jgi:hypothetical protein
VAGLDPAVHSVTVGIGFKRYGMDARIKSGHDDNWMGAWLKSEGRDVPDYLPRALP